MKKIISYSLALGIFSSAILTPYTTASAASLSKAESLVNAAEKHAGVLKWQISYENTHAIKTPDMKVFNNTKSAYLQAQKEISTLKSSDKQKLEKRLAENVGIHYERTMGYIDALTSGNKISALTQKFEQQYAEDPIGDATEKSYHELTAEIRKQAKLLYKVYGKSTRDAFLSTYKAPAETVLSDAKYTISAKGDLRKLDKLVSQKANQSLVEKQVDQLFTSFDMIIEDEIYYTLYDEYSLIIRKDASFIQQEKELNQFFAKTNELINSENVDGVFNQYSSEYPNYENLKEEIKNVFNEVDLKFEFVHSHVYSIIYGYAYVEVTDTITEGTESDTVTTVYLLKKENNEWKYIDIFESY
ncbi:hypothetical protein [Psychrobacillus vulpis]|uniref:SbsC C-terminal domain-containing protein n=1 Tax=Psychrobacillus vulpis TaxID=2325572 RepID=A0A544TV82_9BACI|nr:hypothetical protein [Psychrobacillus vulpis]TQR21335.1 hypothetical protein FG384_03790 [Psychrobacillus vulpis]